MKKTLPMYTHYVSRIDKLFARYDTTHALSLAQLQEMKKYQRIYYLRDTANRPEVSGTLWEQF